MSVGIEAAELMECFQWIPDVESACGLATDREFKERVESEVADVLIYLLSLCDLANIDPAQALHRKLRKNMERFPVRRRS